MRQSGRKSRSGYPAHGGGGLLARAARTVATLSLCALPCLPTFAQTADTAKRPLILTARSTHPERVRVEIRSVDISRFPTANVIIDARDTAGHWYPDLRKNDMVLYQDGQPVRIESIESISSTMTVPVDIVFVIDQTGSMRQEVNEVKTNILEFMQKLAVRGVDYQLGLVTFSDRVERRRELTEDVETFISYVDNITVGGGGDNPENALEGLAEATTLRFRHSAQKIFILITDAPYHQKSEQGDGRTDFTTESMIQFLRRHNIRLFAITPAHLEQYRRMTEETHGRQFDIMQDFSSILDEFSESITNLYAVRYTMRVDVPPEHITLEIRNTFDEVVDSKRVPLLEVDKKFVLENILFEFNRATLDKTYIPELQNIYNILKAYPTIHIEIRGHTDFVGSDEYNYALSDARARAVKKYLVDRGISPARITTRGMGKMHPVAPNDTEIGRRLNRRTEIIITQK
ncbi:MAG: OmpA family protein [Bacteroidota bacterium]|nr:OmpA family protein [Bacteroidota bacterium]